MRSRYAAGYLNQGSSPRRIEAMVRAIVGANWGDEGKGKNNGYAGERV